MAMASTSVPPEGASLPCEASSEWLPYRLMPRMVPPLSSDGVVHHSGWHHSGDALSPAYDGLK